MNVRRKWMWAKTVVVLVAVMVNLVKAQPISLTAQLVPWPVQGWETGATMEVQLLAGGLNKDKLVLAQYRVNNQGALSYTLPEKLEVSPDIFAPLNTLLSKSSPCPIAPTSLPADAKFILATLEVYAGNNAKAWGNIEVQQLVPTGLFSQEATFTFLAYVDRESRLTGASSCVAGGIQYTVQADAQFKPGWNFFVTKLQASLTGGLIVFQTAGGPIGGHVLKKYR